MHQHERVRFINTLLQRGVGGHPGSGTASAVLSHGVKTAEAVSASASASVTPLKQGVNDKASNVTENICEIFGLRAI